MISKHFDKSEHIYRNDAFLELLKDAIRFFNGTPVHSLPPPQPFPGAGVYALYYTGHSPLYEAYSQINRFAYNLPLYVGKAVPAGWRQSRISDSTTRARSELSFRIREHSRNIAKASNLKLEDFTCRFVIFEAAGSDMISTVEAALIKLHKPLWNTVVDGFGNHTPGAGRFAQAKSDWDVIHPGREWAEKCTGRHAEPAHVEERIKQYFLELK
ncbi:restriction endonuclease [Pectobacterium brasiliense]|uniref:Eco29kI family restriction endonuclease n=1 Tax=Pectobacterium brasiliense TaxID=180957 RepID=UPI00057FC841|nr:Eco29kI family restriction endonuclease [Pectobacterium brasiliense]KHS93964.1 restriction endonuclease [Pectobacterium brasiliense]